VWVRADAALAAFTPAQPAITRRAGGVFHTAASARALLDGYSDLLAAMAEKEERLKRRRVDLRAHDRQVDRLNKRWYKVAKASADPGTGFCEALRGLATRRRAGARTQRDGRHAR
jgi:hypothetical protein